MKIWKTLFGGAPQTVPAANAATSGYSDVCQLLKKMCSEEVHIGSTWDDEVLSQILTVSNRHTAVIEQRGLAAIPALTKALTHSDSPVRRKACWALGILGAKHQLPPESLAAMGRMATEADKEVCEQSLNSLGYLAKTTDVSPALPGVLTVLKHPEAKIRKQTVELVGQIGSKTDTAMTALRAMLKDSTVDVAEAAKAAIVKLGGKVETPPAGSLGEIERLARLTTSSEYGVPDKAWADLEKLANHPSIIECLMKTFRSGTGRAMGTKLSKFLARIGTDACRAPLSEIVEYARRSSDDYERKYLVPDACRGLLKLNGGVAALRPSVSRELLTFIVTRGFMSIEELNRAAVIQSLTADERRQVVSDLISFFRSAKDKDDCSHGLSKALEAFGPDAFDALIEVFRKVKQSRIGSDGSVSDKEKGEDGAPASALVRLPGGIARLRSACSAKEFERVLLRAHDYGNSNVPELNSALIELGWIKPVVQSFLSDLSQSHWSEEMRRPAREGLIKLGNKAHPELLSRLQVQFPANRDWQTNLRKGILLVLRESGDEQCVAGIKNLMDSDPAIAQDAHETIKAIAQRCRGVVVPPAQANRALPLKVIGKTGDSYIDACLQIEFPEFYEDRKWHEIPEAKAVAELGNAGRIDEALRLAENLRQRLPDFDFPWLWLVVLRKKQGKLDEARKYVQAGLRSARSKASICAEMGELEFQAGNFSEAAKWWIKSVAVQVGTQHAHGWTPFLHLAYVAGGLGLGDASAHLLVWVDRIHSSHPRLIEVGANEIRRLVERGLVMERGSVPAVLRAVELLDREYLS
jgi:HEAT repeat protein